MRARSQLELNGLPDSRTRRTAGTRKVRTTLFTVEMEPAWCANCGRPIGEVPTTNTNYVLALCDHCWEKLGGVPALEWLNADGSAATPKTQTPPGRKN